MLIYLISGSSLHETLADPPSYWDFIRSSSLLPKFFFFFFWSLLFFASKQLHGHLLWVSEKDWVSVSNTHTIRQVNGLPVFHERERDGLQTARHVGSQAKIEYCTASESQSVAAPCEYKSTLRAASLTHGWCWIRFTPWGKAATDDASENGFRIFSKNVVLKNHQYYGCVFCNHWQTRWLRDADDMKVTFPNTCWPLMAEQIS